MKTLFSGSLRTESRKWWQRSSRDVASSVSERRRDALSRVAAWRKIEMRGVGGEGVFDKSREESQFSVAENSADWMHSNL